MRKAVPLLLLALICIVLVSGCFSQPANVKITQDSLSPETLKSGQTAVLFVNAENYENKEVGPVVLVIEIKSEDAPYLIANPQTLPIPNNLKAGESIGKKSFNITATLPAGESLVFKFNAKVLVNGTKTDSKEYTLTVTK